MPVIALESLSDYEMPLLRQTIFKILEAADLPVKPGLKVLVKPNLLMANKLACTDARVTASVCAWLLEKGAKVSVSDSPGFGGAPAVARAIGLEEELKPVGLAVQPFKKYRTVTFNVCSKEVKVKMAAEALDCDLLFSVARVKAHGQMRLTLCVKNCFGCVPSLRKALVHAIYGNDTSFFAECQAEIWKALPPVLACADGIEAMHITGPSKGKPFPLHLLAVSSSAPALDDALMHILNIDPAFVPLAAALNRLGFYNPKEELIYPLKKPQDFHVDGFKVPETLKSASFNPFRLGISLIRRMWKTIHI